MSTQRYSVRPHPIETPLNLRMSGRSESLLRGEIPAYDDFLEERRKLMALKIKTWFEAL